MPTMPTMPTLPTTTTTPPPPVPMLAARHLAKRHGSRQAVADVSLQVQRGSLLGLLGPNGAGKSTTLALVCGLTPADAGTVQIAGQDLAQAPLACRQRIGLVTQDLALFEDLPARSNLLIFGALYGLSGAALQQRADAVLAQVGLADRAHDRPQHFSGGMKRRLHIACALVHDPDLLLLDEPTAGVDPQSRLAIFELLEALRKAGKALVYTTHHMEEVERLADQLVIIDHGRVVAQGSLADLRAQVPDHSRLDLALPRPADAGLLAALRQLPGVRQAEPSAEGCSLVLDDLALATQAALALLHARGVPVDHLASQRATLEDVFIRLTGSALRD